MAEYLSHSDAVRFIEECEERGTHILGLEWFHREGDAVTPAGVADFSGTTAESACAEAKSLLAEGIPDGANAVEVVTA